MNRVSSASQRRLRFGCAGASRQTAAWQQAVREQTHDERQVIIPPPAEDTKTGKAAKGAPKGSKRRKMGAPVKSFGPPVLWHILCPSTGAQAA